MCEPRNIVKMQKKKTLRGQHGEGVTVNQELMLK